MKASEFNKEVRRRKAEITRRTNKNKGAKPLAEILANKGLLKLFDNLYKNSN